jgi:hypothetical protein
MSLNRSVLTESKAWAWHDIISAGGVFPVPFPEIDRHPELPEFSDSVSVQLTHNRGDENVH